MQITTVTETALEYKVNLAETSNRLAESSAKTSSTLS